MSSIFEALQRSTSERLGIATEQLALAELLQTAEREVPNEATYFGPIDLGRCRRTADSFVSMRTKAWARKPSAFWAFACGNSSRAAAPSRSY
jgi:hypothetical protein